MGKSLGNAIYLSDTEEEVKKKVMGAVTDPNRIKKDDLGNPKIIVKELREDNRKTYRIVRKGRKGFGRGCLQGVSGVRAGRLCFCKPEERGLRMDFLSV